MAALTENFQLKWHSFGSHLHSSVAKALSGDAFCDVSLATMDGHHIQAHRFVLSACSQYLQQVLKLHQRITTTLPLLIILPPQIDHKTMQTLLQYMYRGETTVSKDILDNVLKGGDLLKIRGLWRPNEEQQQPQQPAVAREKHMDVPTKVRVAPSASTLSETKPPPLVPLSNQSDAVAKKGEGKKKSAPPATSADETKKSKPDQDKDKAQAQEETTDSMRFLVIKEEPIEWTEFNGDEMEMVDEDMFHTEMTIKPEVFLEEEKEELYSPLTCELCSETFTLPAEWVRHIQTHTDMLPAKRQRRGRSTSAQEEDSDTFPPLHCDLCQQYFPTPAEWVRHIQNCHTDFELRVSNRSTAAKQLRVSRHSTAHHKECAVCNKKFPSHASMLIHKRTHTGEKPYMCELCHKGFNVKSNLLRHLRTLHDKIINSTDVESKEFAPEGGSEESG